MGAFGFASQLFRIALRFYATCNKEVSGCGLEMTCLQGVVGVVFNILILFFHRQWIMLQVLIKMEFLIRWVWFIVIGFINCILHYHQIVEMIKLKNRIQQSLVFYSLGVDSFQQEFLDEAVRFDLL